VGSRTHFLGVLSTIALLGLALGTQAAPPRTPAGRNTAERCECTVNMPSPATAPAPDKRGTQAQPLIANVAVAPDRETKRLADLTRELVWATFTLGVATVLLASISAWQGWMGRSEFIASNRPRIVLREASALVKSGDPILVNYVLANVGGTKATFARCKFCVRLAFLNGVKQQVAWHEPETTADPGLSGKILEAGGSYWWRFPDVGNEAGTIKWPEVVGTHPTRNIFTVAFGGEDLAFFFFGRVEYKDDRGITREMAFYRQLEADSYRFRSWGDPQLEYSDTNP
jgi:hypothetical protein